MNPLMPSPGRPKMTSTPQSASRSNSTSAVVLAIARTPLFPGVRGSRYVRHVTACAVPVRPKTSD